MKKTIIIFILVALGHSVFSQYSATCREVNPGFTCNASEGICGPVVANPCDTYVYHLATYLQNFNCTNVSWYVSGGSVVSSNNTSVSIQWDYGIGGIEAFGCWPYVGIDLGVNVNQMRQPTFSYNKPKTCIKVKNNHCEPICVVVTLNLSNGGTYVSPPTIIPDCGIADICCGEMHTVTGYSYTFC